MAVYGIFILHRDVFLHYVEMWCLLVWVVVLHCKITGVLIKSLARPTSRCILFDGENTSFDASLVIYI